MRVCMRVCVDVSVCVRERLCNACAVSKVLICLYILFTMFETIPKVEGELYLTGFLLLHVNRTPQWGTAD